MSPLQQAFVITSAVLIVGVVGSLSHRSRTVDEVVTVPTMSGDDMGTTGHGYAPEKKTSDFPPS